MDGRSNHDQSVELAELNLSIKKTELIHIFEEARRAENQITG